MRQGLTIQELKVSSFVASLLKGDEPGLKASALYLSEMLLDKLNGTYHDEFIREGIVHSIRMPILL